IHFNQEFVDWKEDLKELIVKDKQTQATITYPSDILIGADGSASLVRHSLEKNGHTQSNVQHFPFGYKEADIPAGKEGSFLMEKNALHIWPQKNFMLIALPNSNGTFTCTLFLAEEGPVSFQNLNSLTDYEYFVTTYFPDLKELIPTVAHQLFENPVSGLHSISCFPWSVSGTAVLIGDAAHAILPFYGQGMNAGFEDARILSELVGKFSGDWKKIIPQFEQERKPNADAIRVLAENNFIEMRDLVSDPHFLLKKKLERHLVEWTQGQWIPQYTMVTFSHLPYEEALKKGQYQDQVLENIIQAFSIQSNSDWTKLESPVLSYLKKNS
ncbi:MAG: FAD-dependent monooxygenase, partial [Cytophagales bacterium]|nr:FAD-dependent monooxygenase [Cytophagales bacterium]